MYTTIHIHRCVEEGLNWKCVGSEELLLSTITSQHQVSWDCLYKILVAEALCAVQQRPILPSSFSLSATCDYVCCIYLCMCVCGREINSFRDQIGFFFTNRLVWEGIGIEWSEQRREETSFIWRHEENRVGCYGPVGSCTSLTISSTALSFSPFTVWSLLSAVCCLPTPYPLLLLSFSIWFSLIQPQETHHARNQQQQQACSFSFFFFRSFVLQSTLFPLVSPNPTLYYILFLSYPSPLFQSRKRPLT